MIQPVNQYGIPTQISSNTSVSSVPSVLQKIIVSSHTNGTIKVWDNASAASGTVVVNTYTYAAGSSIITFDAKCSNGIFIDMGGTTQQITVNWNTYRG